MPSDLLTVADCERLQTRQVHKFYRRYVNRSQVTLMTSFGFGRELADHAEGCWIYTRDHRKILDFTGGVGVLNHGHNHPRILAARKRFQDQRRMEVHKTYFSPYVAALGHNLAQLLPGDLSMSFFPNSGAEAVEGAVKLAYRYHGGNRRQILHAVCRQRLPAQKREPGGAAVGHPLHQGERRARALIGL
jgi:acetylornithine/succinyldiaminopimelate/putrescine aminotransferase